MKRMGMGIVVVTLLALLMGFGYVSQVAARNIFVMSAIQIFGTIDPGRGTDYTESTAMVNLYDPLVFPSATGEIEPKLAESWTVSSDGLTYIFNLKRGVKFHDGSALTAEDVKFTMDRIIALQDGYSWLWSDVMDEVTVDDRYTVTFHLNKPFAPFVSSLPWLFIVSKDAILAHMQPGPYGEFGDYGTGWLEVTTTEDAGSGPYMLKSWDRGREIVWERFEDYFEGWPNGDQSVDEVHTLVIRETATVKTMIRRGELTMVEHWRTFTDYQEMDRYSGVKVLDFLSTEQLSFKLNTQIPPTDDIHIRRMLAWAFDYQSVFDIFEPGSGPAKGPIPLTIPGHNDQVFQYQQDLEQARTELKQSQYYPNVPPIRLTLPAGNENRRKMALRLKENLAELGVDLQINVEPWGRMTDLATTVETTPNIMVISVASNYPDPDTYLYSMYHSRAAGTWMSTEWLQDPVVDQLIDQERVTLDEVERGLLMNVAQQVINEHTPDIFVYVMPLRVAMQDFVQGFTFRPIMSFYYYFHDLWYEQ
ncbi:MAG: ABC transporter substrate-binding protein [Candidatus Bipolaricaulia bacterium]